MNLFKEIKTEAERLGVSFQLDPSIPGFARYRILEKEVVLSGKHDLKSLVHELVHFLQMEYSFFLWGQDEKEVLAEASKGEKVSLWGLKVDQDALLSIGVQVMEVYPKEVHYLEVPANFLEDYAEHILKVMKEL
jgi:hypothetical protein